MLFNFAYLQEQKIRRLSLHHIYFGLVKDVLFFIL